MLLEKYILNDTVSKNLHWFNKKLNIKNLLGNIFIKCHLDSIKFNIHDQFIILIKKKKLINNCPFIIFFSIFMP